MLEIERINELIEKFGMRYFVDYEGEKILANKGKKATKAERNEIITNRGQIINELKKILDEENRIKKDKKAKDEQIKLAEEQEVVDGKRNIEVYYIDGEYYSGYTPSDSVSQRILDKLECGKHLNGWGYTLHYNLKIVENLGKSFSYKQLIEFLTPIRAEEEQARKEREDAYNAKRKAMFDKAKETGEKQVLSSITADCNDPREECSLDIIYEFAMPDGSITTERQHTW